MSGRTHALDDEKRASVCSLVAVGVSLRQAARYVDCDPHSIRREAQRNDEFRRQLAQARAETRVRPLDTLRQAANTNWRAALSWMERVEPQRFARRRTKGATKSDVSKFVAKVVEAIERIVTDDWQRHYLFEVVSAAMTPTVRQCWDGPGQRRDLEYLISECQRKANSAVHQRVSSKRDLVQDIAQHLPKRLRDRLYDNLSMIEIHDPPPEEDSDSAQSRLLATARRHAAHSADNDLPVEVAGSPADDFASPAVDPASPPRRNADDSAPSPPPNLGPHNDLRTAGEAK